jgi:hypothetical protein
MSINSLLYRAYNKLANGYKAKGRPIKRWRDDIKDTLQQHGLAITDATKQARTRIFRATRHQIIREQ